MNYKLKILAIILFITQIKIATAQVGIDNPNPDSTSVLDMKSTSKGLLIPRMTTAERTAIISPANALMVFDTDLKAFCFYDGVAAKWYIMNNWMAEDNSTTYVPGTKKVGIGISLPDEMLHVSSSAAGEGAHIGNTYLGNWDGSANYASFIHNSLKTAISSYALLQSNTGLTLLNAASGQSIRFRINNTDHMLLRSDGSLLQYRNAYLATGSTNILGIGATSTYRTAPTFGAEVRGNFQVASRSTGIPPSLYIGNGYIRNQSSSVLGGAYALGAAERIELFSGGSYANLATASHYINFFIGSKESGKTAESAMSLWGYNFSTYKTQAVIPGCVSVGQFGDFASISPSSRLLVFGGAWKNTGGSCWSVPSDRRTKKNIIPFIDGLDKLRQIVPVSYEYNGLANTVDGEKSIGVIAQEIEKVIPWAVTKQKGKLNPKDTVETEIYGFNANGIDFLLINAVKELDNKNNEFIKIIKEQQQLIIDLTQRIESLEQ